MILTHYSKFACDHDPKAVIVYVISYMAKKKKSIRRPSRIPVQPFWQKIIVVYSTRTWLRRLTIGMLWLLLISFSAPLWNPIIFPPISHPEMGVSFSQKRSTELGLDWRANYSALLNDIPLRHLRLMSYWDLHEEERGTFDFADLDWQMDEAARHGIGVSLAIGLRQPRWPECHQPDWAHQLRGNAWKQALYAYMEIVVKRYEHHPALLSWQLENEGVNNWFGTCDEPDVARLNEEFDLVKSWSKRPVWMSLSDQHGLPVDPPMPDAYGFSVYRRLWSDKTWPYIGYTTYPTPIWYHRGRAALIKLMTGRDSFIHELQLEPWGATDTKNLTIAEQDKTMSIQQIRDNLYFARELGMSNIYTWGSEWWYWRKVNGDPSIWQTVREEFSALR